MAGSIRKKLSSEEIGWVVSGLVCQAENCLTLLSPQNKSGFCYMHTAQAHLNRQSPRGTGFVMRVNIPHHIHEELAWLAVKKGTPMAHQFRDMLEWGLKTLDPEDRMPAAERKYALPDNGTT